jgi:hypothetical protein
MYIKSVAATRILLAKQSQEQKTHAHFSIHQTHKNLSDTASLLPLIYSVVSGCPTDKESTDGE